MARALSPPRSAGRRVAHALPAGVAAAAAPALLVALALLLFTGGLGQGSLWDQDETKYTEVARQILVRGDPLTLYVNDRPWFVHPPLYMWLQAATARLFGFSEFTARIWTALFGAGGVLATFLLGRLLYDGRTGALAGLMLMTTLEYFGLSRLAIFDVVLVVFMLLTLYMYLVGRDAPPDRRRAAYRWAFVWAGLGTMTKGPIALLLPALAIGAWWLARREAKRRLLEIPWEGVVLYAVIGFTWYAVEAVLHGAPFLRSALGYYLITRFVGVVENQPGPFFYYLPVLAVGGFPWSAFLPSAAIFHWRRWADDRSLILLLWAGITLAFYSAAGTKLPNYILPVFPIAALAIARLWAVALWGEPGEARSASPLLRLGFGLILAAVAALVAAAVIFGRLKYPGELAVLRPHMTVLLALLAAGLGAAAVLHAARRPMLALAGVTGTMVAFFAVLITVTLPLVEPLKPMKPVSDRILEEARPTDRIVGVGVSERASLLYYTQRPVTWTGDLADTRRALCAPPRVFVVTSTPVFDGWFNAVFGRHFETVMTIGDTLLLRGITPIPCRPRWTPQ